MTDVMMTEQLQGILIAERDALKAGDFDRIAELFEEKQALVERLSGSDTDRAHLEPLRNGLRRNQELFDQALAGLRNVASRLGDMNRVRRVLNTYDAQGRSQTIDAPTERKLERRA